MAGNVKKRASSRRRAKGTGSVYQRGERWYYANRAANITPKSLRTTDYTEALDNARKWYGYAELSTDEKRQEQLLRQYEQTRTVIETEEARKRSRAIPLVDAWAAFANGNTKAEKTLRGYRYYWDQFIHWLTANHPKISDLSEVSRAVCLAYADHIGARSISPRTFNATRNALSLVTKRALLRSGVAIENPWQFVESKPLDTHSRKEFTRDQVDSILLCLADTDFALEQREEWELVWHLGAFTGLRLADCVLLTWECIDLDRAQLAVVPLKTKRKGRRVQIPLHPSLLGKLLDLPHPRESFVNPELAARYNRYPDNVQKDALEVLRKLKLATSKKVAGRKQATPQYGFHSLRHTFVSICAEAGVPLATVQAIVGHGSPAMTRHYTHVSMDAARKAMRAFDKPAQLPPKGKSPVPDAEKLARIRGLLVSKKRLSAGDKQILAILDSE